MNRIREIKKVLLLVALPMVMWLFFNQAAFWHYHTMGNGVVVEHAHPYKNHTLPGTPFQKHHHSDFEYSILAQLSNILILLLFLIVLGLVVNTSNRPVFNFYRSVFATTDYHFFRYLRGPPM